MIFDLINICIVSEFNDRSMILLKAGEPEGKSTVLRHKRKFLCTRVYSGMGQSPSVTL